MYINIEAYKTANELKVTVSNQGSRSLMVLQNFAHSFWAAIHLLSFGAPSFYVSRVSHTAFVLILEFDTLKIIGEGRCLLMWQQSELSWYWPWLECAKWKTQHTVLLSAIQMYLKACKEVLECPEVLYWSIFCRLGCRIWVCLHELVDPPSSTTLWILHWESVKD